MSRFHIQNHGVHSQNYLIRPSPPSPGQIAYETYYLKMGKPVGLFFDLDPRERDIWEEVALAAIRQSRVS